MTQRAAQRNRQLQPGESVATNRRTIRRDGAEHAYTTRGAEIPKCDRGRSLRERSQVAHTVADTFRDSAPAVNEIARRVPPARRAHNPPTNTPGLDSPACLVLDRTSRRDCSRWFTCGMTDADVERWHELAAKELKGTDPDSLSWA